MKDEYIAVLNRAMKLGQERHPAAPGQHHAAFANSVAYLVTGMSGGFGGPSMREHAAGRARCGEHLGFDEAVAGCEEVCYGPLTVAIAVMVNCEHCFDDAPGEVEEAHKLLANRK